MRLRPRLVGELKAKENDMVHSVSQRVSSDFARPLCDCELHCGRADRSDRMAN